MARSGLPAGPEAPEPMHASVWYGQAQLQEGSAKTRGSRGQGSKLSPQVPQGTQRPAQLWEEGLGATGQKSLHGN